MANDKDFVVNGPVVVGKDTKVTVGSIAAGTVDLSTGNYFVDSPSGDYTYTFANPGDVQAFQIQATGGSEAVASTFSTTLYDGTGAAQTITNGLDLATDGGLVWIKSRNNGARDHWLQDTERNAFSAIYSNLNVPAGSLDQGVTSYNSNGFSLGNRSIVNASGDTFASWSFKKQTKFFDIVTYTGNGVAGREIAHNLGSTPGVIITKNLNDTENWQVYHRDLGNDQRILLNQTLASGSAPTHWNSTTPTSTVFTVGTHNGTNGSGDGIVAYLFAHDIASDGLIQCGSFVNDASSVNVEVNLGWKPQWLLIKGASSDSGLGHWYIYDSSRTGQILSPNQSAAESADTSFTLTNNGFTPTTNYNGTLIYMAIRSASAPAITWPTNIEWTGGSTPRTPAEGETDVYTFTTDDGGTTYTGVQSIDNAS